MCIVVGCRGVCGSTHQDIVMPDPLKKSLEEFGLRTVKTIGSLAHMQFRYGNGNCRDDDFLSLSKTDLQPIQYTEKVQDILRCHLLELWAVQLRGARLVDDTLESCIGLAKPA